MYASAQVYTGMHAACGDQRQPATLFLRYHLLFETGSLTGLGNPSVSTSLSAKNPSMCHHTHLFLHGFWRLNSGSHIYKVSTLMTELSPQPYIQFLQRKGRSQHVTISGNHTTNIQEILAYWILLYFCLKLLPMKEVINRKQIYRDNTQFPVPQQGASYFLA